MSKLNEIYNFLTADTSNSMEVWNLETDKKIHDKKFRPRNLESFSAFKNEIKQMVNTYGKIGLQRFKLNGNASIRHGAMCQFITNNTDADLGGAGSNPAPRSHHNQNTGMQAPSYNAQTQMPQGLGMAEMGKLQNYDEVKSERDKLRTELETLKNENQTLKLDNKLNEFKNQSGSKLDKLLENPEALQMIASALMQGVSQFKSQNGGANNPGLNAPEVSDMKKQFIADLVRLDPSDQVVQRLAFLLNTYAENKDQNLINAIEKQYKDATRNG